MFTRPATGPARTRFLELRSASLRVVLDCFPPDLLVSPAISHRGVYPERGQKVLPPPGSLMLYPVSVKVKGYPRPVKTTPPVRTGTALEGFSTASRRRLRFSSLNAFPALISQFGLTYHDQWPISGRACKGHLNLFLNYLRFRCPGVLYLWIMEFQTRHAPHYHLFLSIPPDPEIQRDLAASWNRIVQGSPEHLLFHQHSRNWIAWTMGSGSYLCKYLDKESQKLIPEGYANFGRFWGCSRALVPPPVVMPLDDLNYLSEVDTTTGEISGGAKQVIRWLGRYHERATARKIVDRMDPLKLPRWQKSRSRFRLTAANRGGTILTGAAVYDQIERFFHKRFAANPDRLLANAYIHLTEKGPLCRRRN